MLTQFFAQMATLVSADDKSESLHKVGEALDRYSSGFGFLEFIPGVGQYLKLIPEIAKTLGKAIQDGTEKNLADRKQDVVNTLKNQNCRIVVVIDDIDRLSNEQIRLVFQLVSSVAGFPNVVYVLSFDKEIVARALQTVQMDNGHEYLEKVIQVPFVLPEVDRGKITDVFFSRLNELLKQYPGIQVNKDYWSTVYSSCISPYLSTLRDVNRIINALELKLALVREEVNFADLTAITVFQTIRPWLFDWIQQNKTTLVGTLDLAEAFALSGDRNRRNKDSYIQEFSAKCGEEAENVFYALVTLFPKLGSDTNTYHTHVSDDELRREKRIAHIEKFDLYTTLSLENIPLSSDLIRSAVFEYTGEEFSALLIKLNDEQKAADFLIEVKSRISLIPQERIPVLVKSLLQNACTLTGKRSVSPVSLCADTLAVMVVELLLSAMNEESARTKLLLDMLSDCSAECLFSLSDLLNTMELSYGRLAANGNKRGNTIIELDELEQVEEAFILRVSQLFADSEENMLQNPRSRMMCYLWSCFDKEGFTKKLDSLFAHPVNICRYVALFASNPTIIVGSSEQVWHFSGEYAKFVSDELITETLDNMLKDRSFFDLDVDLQILMTAYKVWHNLGKKDMDDDVTESAVKKQFEEWEKSYLKQEKATSI